MQTQNARNMGFKAFNWVVAIIVAIALCSCRTTQMTSAETQADTIVKVQVVHDSVKVVQVRMDSTYLHDSIFVVADSAGKVVYKEKWHTLYRYIYASDSLQYYKAQADSLYKASKSTKSVTRVVESTKWRTRFIWLSIALFFSSISILCLLKSKR